MNEILKYIINKGIDLNEELFKKYFKIQKPSDVLTYLNKTSDKKKNNELVNMINSGLKDLKEEIKKMSEEEKEVEDPESIIETVEQILKFNKQNQEAKGLKILIPNQKNSSEKLKNEIRQLLYSLYRSKNMTKQVYNSLINYI